MSGLLMSLAGRASERRYHPNIMDGGIKYPVSRELAKRRRPTDRLILRQPFGRHLEVDPLYNHAVASLVPGDFGMETELGGALDIAFGVFGLEVDFYVHCCSRVNRGTMNNPRYAAFEERDLDLLWTAVRLIVERFRVRALVLDALNWVSHKELNDPALALQILETALDAAKTPTFVGGTPKILFESFNERTPDSLFSATDGVQRLIRSKEGRAVQHRPHVDTLPWNLIDELVESGREVSLVLAGTQQGKPDGWTDKEVDRAIEIIEDHGARAEVNHWLERSLASQ